MFFCKKNIKTLGYHIIELAFFWCIHVSNDNILKLPLFYHKIQMTLFLQVIEGCTSPMVLEHLQETEEGEVPVDPLAMVSVSLPISDADFERFSL
jgi:hypothetical protein